MFLVTIHKLRPDFRVFIDLLFGPSRNVDSDGDADPVWSRAWRELSLKDRKGDTPRLEIYAPPAKPIAFSVACDAPEVEALAALYLYLFCGEDILYDDEALTDAEIDRLKNKFSASLARAEQSIWHLSSSEHPFPNLSIDEDCRKARLDLLRYRRRAHNESILKMALDGMIEIDDGVLDSSEAEAAARHVGTCAACTDWLDDFYPDREAKRAQQARGQTAYCCTAMRYAVKDPDAQTHFRFTRFRGEDPCWTINDDWCFARFCPWCGEALPTGLFEAGINHELD